MRLFLGLPWPEEHRDSLGRRAAVWAGRPGLRLVDPGNWHLTLRFLGELPETVPALMDGLLSAWAEKRAPLTFIDRGWSRFGPLAKPRAVTLGLEAFPDASRAVDTLHRVLDEAGLRGDGKPWKPHVTLAYGQGQDIGTWPEELPGGRPPILFPRVVLYRSTLSPQGSVYEELAAWPLKGGVTPPRVRS